MSRRSIEGKRAIVTGASSGIGWFLAQQLVAQGARVVATARRAERLEELQRSCPAGCLEIVTGDITDPDVRDQLLQRCQDWLGGLDLLVNNAGIGAMGRFDNADPQRMRKVFEVNFFAVVELTHAALELLKQGADPMIVNISSVLAHRAAPLKSEYCASKFALHGFSDAIRAELAHDGIDLLLVSPSTTDSEFFDSAIEDQTEKNWKQRGAMSPEVVAAKTIRAIKKGKHEIILTHGGRLLVWLDRLIPGLANKIMARYAGE